MNVNTTNLKLCLTELSDIDFQRRAWLAASGPEVSSFSELVSQLFDDTGLTDALEDARIEEAVGLEAAAKLRALDNAVAKIDQSLPPGALINLPAMVQIRELARQALEAIQQH
jgi:hypothetical protein